MAASKCFEETWNLAGFARAAKLAASSAVKPFEPGCCHSDLVLLGMPRAPACTGDGTYQLPTSEEDIRAFLATLERCYNDLYWCVAGMGHAADMLERHCDWRASQEHTRHKHSALGVILSRGVRLTC